MIDVDKIIEQMQWRYAVKVFDKNKKITNEIWQAIEKSLILTPSSHGLQPWRFFVITHSDLKKQLTALSWNQAQVESCSHYVVFTHKTEVSEQYVHEYIDSVAKIRRIPIESLDRLKNAIIGDVVNGVRSKIINEWAARQCYIALGNLMTTAAVLGVDSCPMEGIDPTGYDKLLQLEDTGFKTVMACAVGYRSPDDKNQHFKKVRFEAQTVVRHID